MIDAASNEHASCKLVYLARHGQGYHSTSPTHVDLAEEKACALLTQYGSAAWESHHAMRYGDGTLTWGPDPALTPLGRAQATEVYESWRAAIAGPDPPPVPTVLCSSPLQRSLDTAALTWDAIDTAPSTLYIYEDLREVCGKNTCDQRRTRSQIAQTAPMHVVFADRFVEADEMWTVRRRNA